MTTDALPLSLEELAELRSGFPTVTYIHNETTRGRDEMVSADIVRRLLATITQAHADLAREKERIEALEAELFSAKWKADGYDSIAQQADSGSLTCEHVAKSYLDNHYAYYSYQQDRSGEITRLTQVIKRARLDGALPIRAEIEALRSQLAEEKARQDQLSDLLTQSLQVNDELQTSAENWKDRAETAEAQLAEAVKAQRTPGTNERCNACNGTDFIRGVCEYSIAAKAGHEPRPAQCPIKAARTQETTDQS